MTANFKLIILLVFFLNAVTPLPTTDLEFMSIVEEMKNEISKMDFPKITKDAFSKQYINVGHYSSHFIELLDSYKTLKDLSTNFNNEEKRILTSSSIEDPIEHKVCTQLKYYRKMQEVQCTGFFILHYNLYHFDRILVYQEIIQHTNNMIEMAYVGKFVVDPLILKLHIILMCFNTLDKHLIIPDGFIDQHLREYQKPLGELVKMCIKNNYITELLNCINKALQNILGCRKIQMYSIAFLSHNNDKMHKYLNSNNYKSPVPHSINDLSLYNFSQSYIELEPITNVTIEWYEISYNLSRKILETYTTRITKNPFVFTKFQKMFLDIVRLKLYCFIWLQLFAYQKVNDSKYKERLDSFLILIFDIVELIHIEDKTLNQVLTWYSEIRESNYDQIEDVLKIIRNEVNNILKSFGVPEITDLVNISDVDVENEDEFNSFLVKIEEECQTFGNIFKKKLVGFSYDFLLFFINGSNITELTVFPGN